MEIHNKAITNDNFDVGNKMPKPQIMKQLLIENLFFNLMHNTYSNIKNFTLHMYHE